MLLDMARITHACVTAPGWQNDRVASLAEGDQPFAPGDRQAPKPAEHGATEP